MRTGVIFNDVYTEVMTDNSGRNSHLQKDESISSYFSDGEYKHFKNGDTVINGFDEPDGVYLIKEGFVKSWSTSQDGHANLLLILEAGELMPLPWALEGYHVTGLFYEAMSDVIVMRTSRDKLRIMMGNNMWLTQEILSQAVNVIAIYTQRIQILEFRSARGRVIAEMLFLAQRFGKTVGDEILIEAPITHQDIADSINMNRETASRALEDLINGGFISQTNHVFTVRDPKRLHDALS